jgi:hypothetical protein
MGLLYLLRFKSARYRPERSRVCGFSNGPSGDYLEARAPYHGAWVVSQALLERGGFMRTPKNNCDIKPVDLAYNRLHNAITPRGCAV